MGEKDDCNCPLECDIVSYSSYFVSSQFKPDELCPTKEPEEGLMKEFYVHKSPPQLIRDLEKYTSNSSNKAQDYCLKNIQYRAEVNFQLATNTMSVTVISRRLSFFDKLSGFGNILIFMNHFKQNYNNVSGGILGLFTGISILSMVEITFWIVRYFVNCAKN